MSNIEEKWIKWEPVEIPKGNDRRYYITEYSFTNEKGDRVILEDGKYRVEILFENYTECVRTSEELNRIKTLGETLETPGFFVNNFLFKVENSKFANWLEEESYGFSPAKLEIHFAIVDPDTYLEILSAFEPTVVVTKIGSKSASVGEEMVQISKSEFEEFRALKAEADEKERQKRLEEENDPFAAVRDWEGWD